MKRPWACLVLFFLAASLASLARAQTVRELVADGNGGPWNPTLRPFQFFPNEAYDLDANWEMILAEIDIEGAKRKVAMQLTRGGFLYVLDRATVDMATGRPVESEVTKRYRAGER